MNKSTGLPTGTHYTYRNCFVVMVMPEKVWTSAVTESAVLMTFTDYVAQHSATQLCHFMCLATWSLSDKPDLITNLLRFHFDIIPLTADH